MAETRAISTVKNKKADHIKDRSLLSKLRTATGNIPAPEQVRCIIAECQYADQFALDAYAQEAIAASTTEGFKCFLFVSVKDQADFDAWYNTNKSFLSKYENVIQIQSNLECYESQEFKTVHHAMTAFYLAHPDLKADFDARVLDEAKTYVARQLIKEEKKRAGQISNKTTYPDVSARKESLWNSAPDDLKSRSLAHVLNEAIAVVSWGSHDSNLITVAISGHFTSAMRVAVKHASEYTEEMKIGFKKDAFHIRMVEKRSDLPKIFEPTSSALPGAPVITTTLMEPGSEVDNKQKISPEAKELAAMYMKGLPSDQALDFIFAFNARITGYVPAANPAHSPSTSDSEDEQLSSSPPRPPFISSSPVKPMNSNGPAMYYKQPPKQPTSSVESLASRRSSVSYRNVANDGDS